MRGDQAIQTTAALIEEVAREVTDGDAFIGHVGGDDFVLIVPPEKATDAAEAIVERFDQEVPTLYDPDDRERGYVEVANRRGELQRFPLLSISIGVASTEKRVVRALRGGRRHRHRDEGLHEGDRRVVVGDRPPHDLIPYSGAGSAR